MTDCCQPEPTRREVLARAGVGGALLAAALLLGEDRAAAVPVFETVGLGEERINRDALEARARRVPASAPVPAARTSKVPPAPHIVTRAEWGADESLRSGSRVFLPVRKIVVHHTASPSNPKDPLSWIRMTYRFHTAGRGYSDVGYNFMIDNLGTIYEGRWARDYKPGELHDGEDAGGYGVMGAHALGVNAGTCGIVLLGDFSTAATGIPTTKAVAALTRLIAWECARHQIDPLGADRYVSLNGAARSFPNIAGHRDVGVTGCPGGMLYQLLPTIRQTVAAQVGRFPARTVDFAATIRYADGTRPATKPVTTPPVAVAPWTLTGFRVLTSDGRLGLVGTGVATSTPAAQGVKDPVAIASAAKGGFYTLDSRGGVLAFGGAPFLGSLAKMGVAAQAADLESTPAGDGYWILTADGSIYGFGTARHYGSPKRAGQNATCRALRATPSGKGYWVLTTDGAVLAYGDAADLGSPTLAAGDRAVDLAPTPSGKGWWLLTAGGRVVNRGDAPALGGMDAVAKRWAKPAVAIAAPRAGGGYTVLTADGTVVPFGKVPFFGAATGKAARAIGLAALYA